MEKQKKPIDRGKQVESSREVKKSRIIAMSETKRGEDGEQEKHAGKAIIKKRNPAQATYDQRPVHCSVVWSL